MKISVVMTTYNGELYIIEQLQSILMQTRIPDEVIILDDQSSDNTQQRVNSFISENGLTNWRFVVNEMNLGWKANFAKAINMCSGDVILLSDQDDIWKRNKIRIISDFFSKNNAADLVVSNYSVFYEEGYTHRIANSEKKYKTGFVERVALSGKTFETFRPGCTMGFRRELVDLFNKCWDNSCAHDMVLWDIAVLRKKAYIINASLINQRRHELNNTPENLHNRKGRVEHINSHIMLIDVYLKKLRLKKDVRDWLATYRYFLVKRKEAISQGSFGLLIGLFKYIKYYPSVKSWVGDMVSLKR